MRDSYLMFPEQSISLYCCYSYYFPLLDGNLVYDKCKIVFQQMNTTRPLFIKFIVEIVDQAIIFLSSDPFYIQLCNYGRDFSRIRQGSG